MTEVDEQQPMDAGDAGTTPSQDNRDSGPDAQPAKARDTLTQDEVQRIVAREVNATRRKVEAELKAQAERAEAERNGEYQKLLAQAERERDEAIGSVRQFRAEREVEKVARRLNAEHPEVVYRLIRDDLRYDRDGNPENADDLVARLKADYPRYFAAPVAGADGGKTGRIPADDINAQLRRIVGRS